MFFTYSSLVSFFQKIKALGQTQRFRDWQGDNAFLVRHDVDFDLSYALKMAQIERDVGIKSTFFVLLTCRTYNALHQDSKQILKKIIDCGHEVALHFDPSIYGDLDLQIAARKEAEMLSFATGQEVKSVSLHNPSIYGEYPLIDGYVNAYDPALFSDENYISDSCFSFRGKDPFQFIENIDKGMVQVLLHPLHYSQDGGDYGAAVSRSIEQYVKDIFDDFSVNAAFKKQVVEWRDLITSEKQ